MILYISRSRILHKINVSSLQMPNFTTLEPLSKLRPYFEIELLHAGKDETLTELCVSIGVRCHPYFPKPVITNRYVHVKYAFIFGINMLKTHMHVHAHTYTHSHTHTHCIHTQSPTHLHTHTPYIHIHTNSEKPINCIIFLYHLYIFLKTFHCIIMN